MLARRDDNVAAALLRHVSIPPRLVLAGAHGRPHLHTRRASTHAQEASSTAPSSPPLYARAYVCAQALHTCTRCVYLERSWGVLASSTLLAHPHRHAARVAVLHATSEPQRKSGARACMPILLLLLACAPLSFFLHFAGLLIDADLLDLSLPWHERMACAHGAWHVHTACGMARGERGRKKKERGRKRFRGVGSVARLVMGCVSRLVMVTLWEALQVGCVSRRVTCAHAIPFQAAPSKRPTPKPTHP